MFSRIVKSSRIILSLGIFAFLAVGFLSLSHFSMGMDGEMDMADCPFMSDMTLCDMSPLDHLTGWQSIFSNILTPEILILTLILFAVSTLPYWAQFFSPPKDSLLRLKYSPSSRGQIHSFFQYLFSKGILNTKLF